MLQNILLGGLQLSTSLEHLPLLQMCHFTSSQIHMLQPDEFYLMTLGLLLMALDFLLSVERSLSWQVQPVHKRSSRECALASAYEGAVTASTL